MIFGSNFPKFFRKRPDASERIQMHPNASERFRAGPSRSEQVQNLQKTCENLRKTCENFAKNFEKKNSKAACIDYFHSVKSKSNKPSRNFSRSFREFFEVFARLSRFPDLLGIVWTCSDAFGCVRMHLDAFGCVRMRLDTSRKFRKFLMKKLVFWHFHMFFEEIRKNGRHQQLP